MYLPNLHATPKGHKIGTFLQKHDSYRQNTLKPNQIS